MADVKEYWQGVSGDQDRRLIRYLVTDATDDNDALNNLETMTPLFYDNMPRENITVRELSKKDGLYEGISRYTRRSNQKPAEDTGVTPTNVTGPSEPTEENPDKDLFSFNVSVQSELEIFPYDVRPIGSGGSQVAVSMGRKEGTGTYQEGPTDGYQFDPQYGYRGLDILRPQASFSLAIFPADASVTRSYQKTVMDTVGKVNSVTFRRYQPGELMLVAARGESRNSGDWQFEFTFESRANRAFVDLGNQVTFSNVEGWDVIDPWYVPHNVTAAGEKFIVHRCRQAIVWRPYERVNFAPLIIS